MHTLILFSKLTAAVTNDLIDQSQMDASSVYYRYCIRRIIGGVFNLAAWRIICNLPNLNNAISGLKLLCSLTAIAFCQIKVTPTLIFD